VVSRNPGIKLAVGSLFGALPAIANGFIVCQLVVFIYAIIGISLFKGTFYNCEMGNSADRELFEQSEQTKDDCIKYGGIWTNSDESFDNIFSALSTLYQMITTEGWLEIMYRGVDGTEIGKQPRKNNQKYLAFYFISFILVGNIFILNLFVGIVIDKFNRLKDRMCGYALMTSDQREWMEKEQQMIRLQLLVEKKKPKSKNQILAYKIQSDRIFENFITMCILSSTVVLAMKYYKMPETYAKNLDHVGLVLDIVYNVEALVKIFAIREEYF